VVKGEGLKVDEKLLKGIVEQSEGSFRNAQKLLMELFLEFGKTIKGDKAITFLQRKSGSYAFGEFEKDLFLKKSGVVLAKLEKMAEMGADLHSYRLKAIDYFQSKLFDSDSRLNKSDLSKWLKLLIGVGRLEKESGLIQLPLQLAVVDFIGDVDDVKEVKREVVVDKEIKEEKKIVNDGKEITFVEVERRWGDVLRAVKPFNHSVEAFLRSSKPKEINAKKLVVEVFYPFHKERLEEQRNIDIVQKGLEKVFGVNLLFSCVLSQNSKKESVVEEKNVGDIYDVAKDIFG